MSELGEMAIQAWDFVRDSQNLAVLTAIGGGIGFLLAQRRKSPADVPAPNPVPPPNSSGGQQAMAGDGGTAVNASGSAQVTIGSNASSYRE